MSLLSQLSARKNSKPSPKRVGRGESSGVGKTSGRGHKGQKARSGLRLHPGFEGGQMPLHRRSPKWGFNQRSRFRFHEVNLWILNQAFESGSEVSPEILFQKKLIRNLDQPLKILGTGSLEKELKIKAHAFSKTAEQKITSSKGSIEKIEWSEKRSA